MKASEICQKLDLNCVTGSSGGNNDVMGAYCGDLLSWVIAHAQSHSACSSCNFNRYKLCYSC